MSNYYELEELLWEFNLICNKNCQYCGSRDLLNKSKYSKEQLQYIKNIITKQIIKSNPKSVTFTGGEPSIEYDSLIDSIKQIKKYNKNTSIKLLTNGNIFESNYQDELYKYVDCIGVSINEIDDIKSFYKYVKNIDFNKTTMITNFGNHNIKYVDNLIKIANLFNCWQVQLTMKDDLYLSKNDLNQLKNKLICVNNNNLVDVVFADNFNNNPCFAGKRGCSITFDGLVIPCLSQRAWRKNVEIIGELIEKVGDVIKEKSSLLNIWNKGFDKYRTCNVDCPCCKDFTGIKCIDDNTQNDLIKMLRDNNKQLIKKDNAIFVYGVFYEPNVAITYGVIDQKHEIQSLNSVINTNNKNDRMEENDLNT